MYYIVAFANYRFRSLARLSPTVCDATRHSREIKQNLYYFAKIVETRLQLQKKKFFSVITAKVIRQKMTYFKKKSAPTAERSAAPSIIANRTTEATINL